MARQAMWVHGNAVVLRFPGGAALAPYTNQHRMDNVVESNNRTAWTDIVGMHRDNGATFRGMGGNTNSFQVSIPTPCWRDGVRAQLAMVGLLFTSEPQVIITGIKLFDGPNQMPFSLPSMNVSGAHTTLISNINRLDLPTPINILFGLGITIDVSFLQDGEITFHAFGADFNV